MKVKRIKSLIDVVKLIESGEKIFCEEKYYQPEFDFNAKPEIETQIKDERISLKQLIKQIDNLTDIELVSKITEITKQINNKLKKETVIKTIKVNGKSMKIIQDKTGHLGVKFKNTIIIPINYDSIDVSGKLINCKINDKILTYDEYGNYIGEQLSLI